LTTKRSGENLFGNRLLGLTSIEGFCRRIPKKQFLNVFGTRLTGQGDGTGRPEKLMELSSPKPVRLLHRAFKQSEDASAPVLD
jgi:hypothetical protein